ncbi:MAG: aminotransferase class V-fold PLP-dependent enzyme [Bacteroidetes bacterium]|nr:aminotransferase class V-fold PLP-dependent enzyme [Bacteroidota bacterium]
MANSRRRFISALSALAGASAFVPELLAASSRSISMDKYPDEDTYWQSIRQQFTPGKDIINFNNGGVSPQPKIVQNTFKKYYDQANMGPSYYMWRQIDANREVLRAKLANYVGCDTEELAINRNTTEGLNTLALGFPLQAGDEVILSEQDYPNVVQVWKQRELRDKIVLKWVHLDLPEKNEDVIAKKYISQITPRTKLICITHIINWTGQVMPVQKICKAAAEQGIKTVVDGAHTVSHLEIKISDLNCDFFASSLHKWTCAPLGTGILYVKKGNAGGIWPLHPNNKPLVDDIRKFEILGTRNMAAEHAISAAIDFNLEMGLNRKYNRLCYLKNYWMEKITNPRVYFLSEKNPTINNAICNFGIEGLTVNELADYLFNKYKIHTSPIDIAGIKGCRVTPHVYTSLSELDVLVEAVNSYK